MNSPTPPTAAREQLPLGTDDAAYYDAGPDPAPAPATQGSEMTSHPALTRKELPMTSRDFCYWLQGYFEGAETGRTTIAGQCPAVKLTTEQVQLVRRHLAMVFIHEIDPSAGDAAHQAALNAAHGTTPAPNPGPVYRC